MADQRDLINHAVALRQRALTPEQLERRRKIDARNDALQRLGVKPPQSGIFGKGKPND